jgi:hypothetical protein
MAIRFDVTRATFAMVSSVDAGYRRPVRFNWSWSVLNCPVPKLFCTINAKIDGGGGGYVPSDLELLAAIINLTIWCQSHALLNSSRVETSMSSGIKW